MNKDLVLGLQGELEDSRRKIEELEDQVKWQEQVHQNQLNLKEARIQQLKKSVSSTNHLQDQVCDLDQHQIHPNATMEPSGSGRPVILNRSPSLIEEASRQTTSGSGRTRRSSQPMNFPIRKTSLMAAQVSDNPYAAVSGAHVFKQKLQRVKSMSHAGEVGDSEAVEVISKSEASRVGTRQPWSVNRPTTTVQVRGANASSYRKNSSVLPGLSSSAHRRYFDQESGETATLPVDYRARVATLPPIVPNIRRNSGDVIREYNISSLALDKMNLGDSQEVLSQSQS